MNWKIPLFKIYHDQSDIEAAVKIIGSGMQWAEGQSISDFEQKISEYFGVKYAIVFNSGTSALHAVLLAYGLGRGDEVIVPSFTFIATANAPLFVGAKPVFADIEEETYGLDPQDVEKKITRRTKAIVPIHYGGCPCKIEELKKIAKKYNLLLIEDAAESFGAKVSNRKVATFGDAACLSFCQNKIITTGEGGAIITSSAEIYEKLKAIRSHGRFAAKNYFLSSEIADYENLGYNFRMPTLIAALGIAQLAKVNKVIQMRREKAHYLNHEFRQETKGLVVPSTPKDYFHVYQMYTLCVKKERNALMRHLNSKGIMTKIYFPPVHLTRFYRHKLKIKPKLSVTERIASQVLTLPLYPGLSKGEMNYMVKAVRSFLSRGKKGEKSER
jgi:perosamine synthetase